MNGVLNGASTAVVTSLSPNGPNATSSDVSLRKVGDMLTATGVVTLLPSKALRANSRRRDPDDHWGSGKYKGATGKTTIEGRAVFDSSGGETFDVIYRGSVCGPNLKADRS